MSGDEKLELFRTLRASQDRYVYFLLAAVGAAIAFAITQTRDAYTSWSQIPLALAVLTWALSFYFGCRNIAYVNSTIYANSQLLLVQDGDHPEVGQNLEMRQIASSGIRAAIESNSNWANLYVKLQFRFFVAGSLLYITWHAYEMYLRAP